MAKKQTLKFLKLANYPVVENLPTPPLHKAHPTDAGFDLYSAEDRTVSGNTTVKIKTGLAVDIPTGYYGKIFDRSSVASESPFTMLAGVIDAHYTGEIVLVVHNRRFDPWRIIKGQKLAQMLIMAVPDFQLEEVTSFDTSQDSTETRGTKGFGSSDTPPTLTE